MRRPISALVVLAVLFGAAALSLAEGPHEGPEGGNLRPLAPLTETVKAEDTGDRGDHPGSKNLQAKWKEDACYAQRDNFLKACPGGPRVEWTKNTSKKANGPAYTPTCHCIALPGGPETEFLIAGLEQRCNVSSGFLNLGWRWVGDYARAVNSARAACGNPIRYVIPPGL